MMKKKLLFMFAAIIMVAGTIFQTKAYRCGVNTGCPDGYSCYHGVCVPGGGEFRAARYQTMAYCFRFRIVPACTTKQYYEGCRRFYCIVNH